MTFPQNLVNILMFLMIQTQPRAEAVRDETGGDMDCTRKGNEIDLEPMPEKVAFDTDDGLEWLLTGNIEGGAQNKGKFGGTYQQKAATQKATIKRDETAHQQIAEILASRLINSVLPETAAVTKLARLACKNPNIFEPKTWGDVYVASLHNKDFSNIMMLDARVKEFFTIVGYHPLVHAVLPGAPSRIKKAYEKYHFFNLASLQKAFIGNLLVANNDMHMGNMVLYGPNTELQAELQVEAFDFGAAFNFAPSYPQQGGAKDAADAQVNVNKKVRGRIAQESAQRLWDYPKAWSIESPSFWKLVEELPEIIPETAWIESWNTLTLYYDEPLLETFMTTRIFDSRSNSLKLNDLWTKFKDLMNTRLKNFKDQAKEFKKLDPEAQTEDIPSEESES